MKLITILLLFAATIAGSTWLGRQLRASPDQPRAALPKGPLVSKGRVSAVTRYEVDGEVLIEVRLEGGARCVYVRSATSRPLQCEWQPETTKQRAAPGLL